MKKLYVRFFSSQDDQIPQDSRPFEYYKDAQYTLLFDVCDWMKSNPNGKVEFIYL